MDIIACPCVRKCGKSCPCYGSYCIKGICKCLCFKDDPVPDTLWKMFKQMDDSYNNTLNSIAVNTY